VTRTGFFCFVLSSIFSPFFSFLMVFDWTPDSELFPPVIFVFGPLGNPAFPTVFFCFYVLGRRMLRDVTLEASLLFSTTG